MSFTQVFTSPLNKSTSKQIYSFPRTERFTKDHAPLCDQFYEIPTTKTTRSSGFGLGSKSDLASAEHTPPPGKYEQKGEFQEKNRGYSFTSRPKSGGILDKCSKVGPGPGTYDGDCTKLLKNISFSIGKSQSHPKIESNLGPGKYEIQSSINQTGRYYYSKYYNSRCGKIGKAKRFNDTIDAIPGPAKYHTENLGLNPQGDYTYAKLRSSHGRSFTRASRDNLRKDVTPGPGSYHLFSEFADKFKSLDVKKHK